MSLDAFISTISRKDVARQNRFEVSIQGPKGMANRDVNMMCENATFPGQNMRTSTDDLRYGPVREIVHGVTYGPINLTFICTDGMFEKKFFEMWQEQMFDRESWTVKYYEEYIGHITMSQLNRRDTPSYTVDIYEAYPKTITAQDFNLGNNDAYQTIAIEFAFHHWVSQRASQSGGRRGRGAPSAPRGMGGSSNPVGNFIGQLAGGMIGSLVARKVGGSMGGFLGAQVSQIAGGFVGGLGAVQSAGAMIGKAGQYTNIAGAATNMASGAGSFASKLGNSELISAGHVPKQANAGNYSSYFSGLQGMGGSPTPTSSYVGPEGQVAAKSNRIQSPTNATRSGPR